MKRNSLLLSVLILLAPVVLRAQTTLPTFIMPTDVGDSAIVREYRDEFTVVYAQPSSSQGRFYLMGGSQQVRYFDLPRSVLVRDFEIMGDTAYFCGLDASGAVFGGFDLVGTFSGTMPVEYVSLSGLIGGTGTNMYIDSLQRIALFRRGADVVMAMVGRSRLYNYDPVQRTTVVGAILTSGYGIFCASFEKQGLTWYTDVACLDGMVVAVGRDTNGVGQYAKVYDNSAGFSFPSTTTYQMNKIKPPMTTIGRVLVTRTGSNTAACLQLGGKPTTVLTDLAFSTTSLATPNGPALYPQPLAMLSTNTWQLGEVRYNGRDKIVYATIRGCLPSGSTLEPLLLHYPYGVGGYYPITNKLLGWQPSLDIDQFGRTSLTGEFTGMLDIYHKKFMPMSADACSQNDMYLYYPDNVTVSSWESENLKLTDGLSVIRYTPNVYGAVMEIKCR